MPLESENSVLGIHAESVIGHLDPPLTTLLKRHQNLRRAGIQGVLNKLLNRGSRSLDHLAGRDSIRRMVVKENNAH